jgi:alkylation response protein AidB-like acyl-CoA dehydrogenase
MYDFNLTTDEETLVAKARWFAVNYVRPRAAEWERARVMPRDALKEAAKIGLTLLDSPKSEGGGTGFVAKLLVLEALSEEDMAFAFSLTNTQGMAGRMATSGTPSQKERFLKDLQSTERLSATCLTEPGAGSDFSGIQTSARKVEGGWRLSGEKAWITNAAEADVFLVYAQCDPEKGWRGIASFLVDARQDGFERVPAFGLLSGHTMGVGGFKLHDIFVPDEDIIGGPGEAFKAAMNSINGARTYVAGMINALVHSSLHHAVTYGAERQAFGKSILDNQGISWSLAKVANNLEASRLLTYRAAKLIDADVDAMLAAAHAKKFAGDFGVGAVADCIQAMGANGMRDDVPLGRHLACAKLACYADGSTEIMNDRIGKSLIETFGS